MDFDVYQDIAERTDGDIYLGVMGPIRTGKSTFVKRFMEQLVIPRIDNNYKKERAKDELPQSAAGKTIMTVEPKFVPNEAIEINIQENNPIRVRLIDSVGYLVKGALGYMEEDKPRMVKTPWSQEAIPFEKAAEIGTKKIITDHSTIGIMITTDGSITDIPRENYVEAEERVVKELKEINKPFIIILNTTKPNDQDTKNLHDILQEKYDTPVMITDVLNITLDDIKIMMQKILFEFPIREINFNMPDWIDVLENSHWFKGSVIAKIKDAVKDMYKIRDLDQYIGILSDYDKIDNVTVDKINLGNGQIDISINPVTGLYFQILSEISGYEIKGDYQLISLMKELSYAKRQYDKMSDALNEVRNRGYGVVIPTHDDMKLADPEIVKQGGKYAVKLKAAAPSMHMIRVDIETEVTPIVGTEKQSEDFVDYITKQLDEDPKKVWEANIFGKSLDDIINEEMQSKLTQMPDFIQDKFKNTLQRVVNDGGGGILFVIL